MKNVEEELPKGLFAKCSNWCLVGLTHVAEIKDDTVIVEFGSNKNCRIPMQKAAISAVEKPEEAAE